MKLSQLLRGTFGITTIDTSIEITDVTNNTARIQKGCVFVCIKGASVDGHSFASKALEMGAAAVVVSQDLKLPNQILVEDTQVAFARMCANFFGNPSEKLTMIGITGTNGKTSTSSILRNILEYNGHKTGLIGTIENVIGDEIIPSTLTTPDSYALNELFARMLDAGCTHCVMEVSSHALKQKRTEGIHFKVGVFSNLSRDHLDYHKTVEDYFFSKCKLFEICDTAVINIDDEHGQIIANGVKCPLYTYSAKKSANFKASDIEFFSDCSKFTVETSSAKHNVCLKIPGEFSVYNGMAAVCAAIAAGLCEETAMQSLSMAQGVKGRVEVFPCKRDYTFIIDYAHTPDGLQKVLETIRAMKPRRIVTLFGCGGDRDKTKRPIMGEIAAEYSDFVIVTSDNPRTEPPMQIIEDIMPGVLKFGTEHTVIENREQAIKYAVDNAKSGDVILLAGKGHETYQILGTEKIHFDEREVLAKLLG